jgi:hypothetical protein
MPFACPDQLARKENTRQKLCGVMQQAHQVWNEIDRLPLPMPHPYGWLLSG